MMIYRLLWVYWA